MKEVNLISIVHAYKTLSKPLLQQYFSQFKISPKEVEMVDLGLFTQQIKEVNPHIKFLDKYFFGYVIPQISKEFDLLRFGKDSVINIELKSESSDVKILKQLIRNNYYLTFLNKKIFCFTYVSSEKQLYSIDEKQNLYTVSFEELINVISVQELINVEDINHLFNPSNYLVSPFNSTDEFMSSKYFLTARQEEIRLECLKMLIQKGSAFISICGKAGTGKTLLTFDIAKKYLAKNYKVLIIHCGILNQGHIKLREEYRWDIIAIKYYTSIDFGEYSLVILDECQRIKPYQLEIIIDKIKASNNNCIFSYDNQQCLRNEETRNNISKLILDQTSPLFFELTDKIRTNREIASFIIALFDKSKVLEKLSRGNVELSYFHTASETKNFANQLKEDGWKIINYTPSKDILPYDDYHLPFENSTHEVIGQEFDKVVAIIDRSFCYSNNALAVMATKSPYYHPVKMLFQIMTRTRIKLHVIIVNNPEILERCINILDAQ
ncbi:DNA/RNA helicase domain-containing protein [Pedobacter sp. CFBP9032]|uniref:DNA/RNA helicase domain-containing protein n=1 Tax=Pedobacter sp. CFBP9032 TaxID=3096539 RepID=UPI002A6A81D9|nr:DNA/RNA helicase domain-containing protein [Pedobacter sp. CFBP9032]MDY0906289.1 hypothetical protein [Pedobacter sp. CFBP9032]